MEHCVREIHCYWPMWLDLITEMESVQKEWRARLASVLYGQFCDNPKYKTEQKMTLKRCWLMNCFLQEKWSGKMFAWKEKWHTLIDRYRWGDHWCDSYLAHTVLCWRCVCDCVYLSARVFVEFWAWASMYIERLFECFLVGEFVPECNYVCACGGAEGIN